VKDWACKPAGAANIVPDPSSPTVMLPALAAWAVSRVPAPNRMANKRTGRSPASLITQIPVTEDISPVPPSLDGALRWSGPYGQALRPREATFRFAPEPAN